jgi:ankyrin repeat protein
VRLLLDHGADINDLGFDGAPLHLASRCGHIEVVETLLDHGANIEIQDNRGIRPLHSAVSSKRGDVDIVRLLLDRGANINAPDRPETFPEPATPTPFTICGNAVGMCPDYPDVGISGWFSLETGSAKLLEAMRDDFSADINLEGVKLPLKVACLGGNAGIVECLLKRGADVDQAGGYPHLLECAAFNGNAEVVQLLLGRGADPNEGINHLPLELAAAQSQPGVLRLLIDRGADVNRGRGRTPLEAAATEEKPHHVAFLLQRGADPNLGIRRTPLEAAARNRSENVIRLLLDEGADVNKAIAMTPLEALIGGLWGGEPFDLAQLLIEREADINRGIIVAPLQIANGRRYRSISQLLIEKGAGVKVRCMRTSSGVSRIEGLKPGLTTLQLGPGGQT